MDGGPDQEVDDHQTHDGERDKQGIAQPAQAFQHQNANNGKNNDNLNSSISGNKTHDLIPARRCEAMKELENGSVPSEFLVIPDCYDEPSKAKERNEHAKEESQHRASLSQDELANG